MPRAARLLAAGLVVCALLGCASAYHNITNKPDYQCENEAQLDSQWMCAYCKQNGVNITGAAEQSDCEHCVLQWDDAANSGHGDYTVGPLQASSCYDCIVAFPNTAHYAQERKDCYNCSKYTPNKYAAWACPWCANATLSWGDAATSAQRRLDCFKCIQAFPANADKDQVARDSAACVDRAYGRDACSLDLGHETESQCQACVAKYNITTFTPKKRDACYQVCTNTTLVPASTGNVYVEKCLACIEHPNVTEPWSCEYCMQQFAPSDPRRQDCFDMLTYFNEAKFPGRDGDYAWAAATCLKIPDAQKYDRDICLDCLKSQIDPTACAGGRYNPLTHQVEVNDYVGRLALDCYNTSSIYAPLDGAGEDHGLTAAECRTCQWNSMDSKAWACTTVCRNATLLDGSGSGDLASPNMHAEALVCSACVTSRPDPASAFACQNCMEQTNFLAGQARTDARAACGRCIANNPYTPATATTAQVGNYDWACGMCSRKSPTRRDPCIACLEAAHDPQYCLNLPAPSTGRKML